MAIQKKVGTTAERKKADAWLNFSLPVKSKTTGQVKQKSLGGIPLDADNPLHAKVIDTLSTLSTQDTTAVIAKLLTKGLINLVVTDNEDTDDFELGA